MNYILMIHYFYLMVVNNLISILFTFLFRYRLQVLQVTIVYINPLKFLEIMSLIKYFI